MRLSTIPKGNIKHMQKIIGKVFLVNIVFIPAANNKFIHTVGRIHIKDMPKNGPTSNLYHQFRFAIRFFGDTYAETSYYNK